VADWLANGFSLQNNLTLIGHWIALQLTIGKHTRENTLKKRHLKQL